MAYELCMNDEYNTSYIVERSNDINALVKRGRQEVTNANMDNALTSDEKKRDWGSYFVELASPDGDEIEDAVFGGPDKLGKPSVLLLSKEASQKVVELKATDAVVRIFAGRLDSKDWFATDDRGREINDINHPSLRGKNVYYLRVAK